MHLNEPQPPPLAERRTHCKVCAFPLGKNDHPAYCLECIAWHNKLQRLKITKETPSNE